MVVIYSTEREVLETVSLMKILRSMKKEEMLRIAKRLDLYVSRNVTKEKTAQRIADQILDEPAEVVSRLSRTELLLLERMLEAGEYETTVVKMRKTPYMMQKWGLVVTYEDEPKGEWQLYMPDELKVALRKVAPLYISLAKKGEKGPSARELRFHALLDSLTV